MRHAELIELRREIHRHPELAGAERRTAALVADALRGAGLDVRTDVGGHGVVAILDAGDGPAIGYRADLDAVAVPGGAAHLCGHDVHTAIGVGVARALTREQTSGRAVFFFQPAEETCEGARAMIGDGALDPVPPREVYALHSWPLPVGKFGVAPGFGYPGQDIFRIEGLSPEEARRFESLIEGLSTVTPPAGPDDLARLAGDLQTPDGPLASFVHAQVHREEDAVQGWVRAWPDSRYEEIRTLLRSQAGPRVRFLGRHPTLVNSPEHALAGARHLNATVFHASYPFSGEDFGLFLERAPGAMFFFGVGEQGVPHASDFVVDESAIGLGVDAMTGFLRTRSEQLSLTFNA
ncbi:MULTISPECIES: M20 metallopeptidase family protein [Streptosporangium]|uniref:Metal-dependent amidase/aminoacylase/carboxypeptidase family protein n=1 Tax=Streptosporangium brasiliense TaxID=47480 RepID=A0ABT9R2Q4_9ACTN|nr:M20/M25/M40 family metallo-hydrolase [Streptosporangium brasiliense]MDP9863152.1 metal-dependent amidase/aminoacylase/carboxypeptidase family protein [Streptosporangium brasiliense]